MKLVESKNLGYSRSGSSGVQEPVNLPEMNYPEARLNMNISTLKSLYEDVVEPVAAKPIISVIGIEKAISRLMYPYFNDKCLNYGGFGFDAEGNFYADYYNNSLKEFNRQKASNNFAKARRQIFKIDTDGNMSAVCVDEEGNRTQLFLNTSGKSQTHTSSGVIYALTAYIIFRYKYYGVGGQVAEILNHHFEDFILFLTSGNSLDLASIDRVFDADIYTMLAKDNDIKMKYGLNAINVAKYDRDEFPILTDTEFNLEMEFGNSPIFGSVTSMSTGTVSKGNGKLKDYLGKFSISERVLSAKEKELVPDDRFNDYIVREEVIDSAKLICESTDSPNSVRNILWTGGSGTGKTTACQMLAKLLNLPYVFYTFHPSTEINDLYMNILPRTGSISESNGTVESLMEKLDFTSIAFDPAGSYESITGENKPDATENDCKEAIAKMLVNAAAAEGNDSQFISVESPLVQAFRYGYVCELQEANVAKKPGVLAGINAALDNLATIQLPSGEVVKRHKDTVIILTANIGYESRSNFDQAVVSRCQIYDEFEAPSDSELKKLIQLGSGFNDSKVIDKMLKVYHAIVAKLEETGATDGVCGVRELIQWALMSKTFSPYKACKKAVINKATFDSEVRHELIICLETQFKNEEEFNF